MSPNLPMRPYLEKLYARLAQQVAEEVNKYSPDEAARRKQAGEWINWPLYITQPVIPILFYLLHFADVIFFVLIVLVINVIWIRIVSQTFVSLPLSRLGSYVAHLKWIASPLLALMLWHQGYLITATVALSWSLLIVVPLFALHRLWPDGALDQTQRLFRTAAKYRRTR